MDDKSPPRNLCVHLGTGPSEVRGLAWVGGVEDHMRFIHLFLVGYFILIVGVGLALWQIGILDRIAPVWIGIGATVAVGLGIMLSVSSGKPTVTEEFQK